MIYFDNAATTKYKPDTVLDIMHNVLSNPSNPGRSAHNDAITLSAEIFNARENIKNLLSADSRYEVIFTKNTTEALNLAILGYISTFRHKIHVITSMLEHNSVLRPLKHLAKIGAIDVTVLPLHDGTVDMSDLELNIRNNTRLIVLNHMSNVLGTCIDIDMASAISSAYNIPLLIDGAQSLGHARIDLCATPIAMLAAAGHKGLHGPMGSGFLLVDRTRIQLNPIMYGGTGTNSNMLDMDIEYPESFETGTLNAPAILGLDRGATWTYANFETINARIDELSRILYGYLSSNDNIILYSPTVSSVQSFNVGEYSSEEVATYLNEKNIAVRSGLHCAPLVHGQYNTTRRGMVRASLGYNNTMADVNALITALEELTTNIRL